MIGYDSLKVIEIWVARLDGVLDVDVILQAGVSPLDIRLALVKALDEVDATLDEIAESN